MNKDISEELKASVESIKSLLRRGHDLMEGVPIVCKLLRAHRVEATEQACEQQRKKLRHEIVAIAGAIMPGNPQLVFRSVTGTPRPKITKIRRQAVLSELCEHLFKIYPEVRLTLDEVKFLVDYTEAELVLEFAQALQVVESTSNK